jgi:hypothetical protein
VARFANKRAQRADREERRGAHISINSLYKLKLVILTPLSLNGYIYFAVGMSRNDGSMALPPGCIFIYPLKLLLYVSPLP